MIHAITANKTSFNSVRFTEGLNLVVASRGKAAEETGTRNSLGKTTLLHIIDFLLGSEPNRGDTLRTDMLTGWVFTMEATISDNRVLISRKVDEPDVVYVRRVDGENVTWPNTTSMLPFDGSLNYGIDEWRDFLGWALFGLDLDDHGLAQSNPFRPVARELIHYFLRLGYEREMSPVHSVAAHNELSVAFLFGLNWEYLRRLNELKNEKADVDALARVTKLKLKEMRRNRHVLQVECTRLQSEITALEHDIANYRIHESYVNAERNAAEYRTRLNDLRTETRLDKQRLVALKASTAEANSRSADVREIYAEARLLFPTNVSARIEEVMQFHQSVYRNRREFLKDDAKSLEQKIEAASAEMEELRKRLETADAAITAQNALDEYAKFNKRLADCRVELAAKQRILDDLRRSEEEMERLKEEKRKAAGDARSAFADLEPLRDQAEANFKRITKLLYNAAGSLNIKLVDEGKKFGFKFSPNIPYDRSSGIKDIRIFSFDLTLYLQQLTCKRNIDFLIHDSTIFDSADPRQVALALKEADRATRERHGQYICTMNSNMIEGADFEKVMSKEEVTSRTRLMLDDSSDKNSLLGFRFK